MKCPVCLTPDLVMADRQGIEIDYCPQCRGVWLDRGELDKIIERAAAAPGAAPQAGGYAPQPEYPQQPGYAQQPGYPPQQPGYPPQQPGYPPQQKRYDDDYYKHGGHGYGDGYHHKKKRKGFLGDIFDFD